MKRRILEDLKITEISGVDRPCQEGAIVTLMKRAPDPKTDTLSARLAKLKKQVDLLKKFNPGQKRDDTGKWTDGGGTGSQRLTSSELKAKHRSGLITREQLNGHLKATKKPGMIARGSKAALTAYLGVKRAGGKILRTAWDIDSALGHTPSIALAGYAVDAAARRSARRSSKRMAKSFGTAVDAFDTQVEKTWSLAARRAAAEARRSKSGLRPGLALIAEAAARIKREYK